MQVSTQAYKANVAASWNSCDGRTPPFSFEGKKKHFQAQEGINGLRKHCDTVLIILNDKIQTIKKMNKNIKKIINIIKFSGENYECLFQLWPAEGGEGDIGQPMLATRFSVLTIRLRYTS